MIEFIIILFIVVAPFALILNARKRGQRERLEAKRWADLTAATVKPPAAGGAATGGEDQA